GLLGQLTGMYEPLLVGVQGLEERGREAPRGPEARARRDVRHAGQLQVGSLDAQQGQGLPDDRMAQLGRGPDALQARVLDDQLRDEGLVQRDVHVPVDGGGDQEPRVLAVVGGQVGAAAPQGDAQRAPGDDHRPYTSSITARAARASSRSPEGARRSAMQASRWWNSSRHETSSPGYSQVVVS